MKPDEAFSRLYEIIVTLRSPDGCPWDREQTPQSLRRHVLEETYECIEAIESDDSAEVQEELGDLYLLVTMIGRIYEETERFTVSDVLEAVAAKLVRRHPHVFAGARVDSTDDVLSQWQRIKTEQEGKRSETSILDSVSRALPALERAYKLQRKAAKVGFDWPSLSGVRDKLMEEVDEVLHEAGGETALPSGRATDDTASAELEQEVGDMLFSAVNLARYLGVDPSVALNAANTKFAARFRHVEDEMKSRAKKLSPDEMELMDELWNAAKATERDEQS
jgi:tetrapyrrole methylase family protein/MazG family protein